MKYGKENTMKKYLSAFLAVAMTLSLTACKDKENSSVESTDESSAVTETVETPVEGTHLSNPVKFTEEGDIDMQQALSYTTDFDAFLASMDAREVDLSKPVSQNAQKNEKTMEVFNYLKSIYGKQIMSCQQQMDLNKTFEDKVYYMGTDGNLPAMKGFDFIFCTGSYQDFSMTDAAIKWSKESGGLVTFTWHWNVPRDIDDPDKGWAFYQEDIINWNPQNVTTPGTKEYEQAIHDIDLIASELQRMEKEGVTVLFRPFHEASGAWFWWGLQQADKVAIKEGTYNDTFQKLWYMMYDRMENYHKLTNLIWVWNGQSKFCTVHPNTYDIAGIDYYADKENHTPCVNKYKELKGYTYEGKMLALSECGYIPDPQQCADEGIMWLYYMIWNGNFVYNASGNGTAITNIDGTPSPNTERMTNEMLAEYFSNENLVSWRTLPQFSFGEKNVPEAIRIWEYVITQ